MGGGTGQGRGTAPASVLAIPAGAEAVLWDEDPPRILEGVGGAEGGKSPVDPSSLCEPETTGPPVVPPAGCPAPAAPTFTPHTTFCSITSRPWKMEFFGWAVGGGGGGGGRRFL